MAINFSKQNVAAAAIAVAMGAAAYLKFFWLPISDKQAALTKQIAETDAKIAKAEAQASRLKRLQDELAALNRQAVEAEARLPKDKDVPDIILTLTRLAERNDVSIQSFSPGPQKGQQYFTELSYPMAVSGSYHAVGRFFASLALETRIFNVKDVVFPGADGGGRMTVMFTLLTYQYKG